MTLNAHRIKVRQLLMTMLLPLQMLLVNMCTAVVDLDGGRAGFASSPLGRRTNAVTVLLISENGTVLWVMARSSHHLHFWPR